MQSRVPVVEDLDVMIGMMRGILLNLFFLYAIAAVLAGLWWYFRPRCSFCGDRVRIGKGKFHLDAEHNKVWVHSDCEQPSKLADCRSKSLVISTGV